MRLLQTALDLEVVQGKDHSRRLRSLNVVFSCSETSNIKIKKFKKTLSFWFHAHLRVVFATWLHLRALQENIF